MDAPAGHHAHPLKLLRPEPYSLDTTRLYIDHIAPKSEQMLPRTLTVGISDPEDPNLVGSQW